MNMKKKLLLILTAALLVLTGCQPSAAPEPTAMPTPTATPVITDAPAETPEETADITAVQAAALASDAEALPAPEPVEAFTSTPQTLVTVNGELFVLGWDGLYRMVGDGWALTRLEQRGGSIEACAPMENGLCVLARSMPDFDPETGEILKSEAGLFSLALITLDDDGVPARMGTLCRIAWDVNESSWPQVNGLALAGDAAYILLHDDESDWELNALYRIDLKTGKGTKVLTDHLLNLIAYKDGLLAARRFNWNESYQNGKLIQGPEIVSIDPAQGTVAPLYTMHNTNSGALVYAAEEDAFYFADSSFVYRVDGSFSPAEAVGYLASTNMGRSNSSAALYQGRYYLADWGNSNQLIVTATDPSLLPTRTLRLSNFWNADNIVRDFAKARPDVAIEYVESNAYGAEEYRSHMESPQAADIYNLGLPYDAYAPLLKYGLLTDLSGSEALMDVTGRMYPHLTKAYLTDGHLYGLPVYVSGNTFAYYPDTLEKVGLTADDMPVTYMELLDFLADWHNDYADEYEDVSIFEWSQNMRSIMINLIFQAQALRCEATGETFTFRTPAIQALLQRIDSPEMKVVFEALGPKSDSSGGEVVYYDDGPHAIFTSSYDPLPSMYQQWMNPKPMLLRFERDDDPVMQFSTQLLVVNKASKNQDLALELLEYIAAHLRQDLLTAMMPDVNEPIEVEYYKDNVKSMNETIKLFEKQVEEAEDEETKQVYQESIERYREYLQRMEEEERWAFTAEDIAFYRESVAPYLVASPSSIFTGKDNPVASLLSQYVEGARDMNAFLSEIDRVVRMIDLEGK